MSSDTEQARIINRREAIRRVSVMLGGVAFVGGSGLLSACEKAPATIDGTPGTFNAEDIAFLDEIAETILPATKTPGAKAAKTGAFMALMVTDSYGPAEQRTFRDGMRSVDDASKKANNASFMSATPPQRQAVLTKLDREQKSVMDAREAADRRKRGLVPLPAEPGMELGDTTQVATAAPAHYFRMMKELALLGYFTSEIGYTQAMRYVESPGRYDPCVPYTPGEPSWAAHA
jgi:hypothetical protein